MSIRTRLTALTAIPLAVILLLSAGLWLHTALAEAELTWQDFYEGNAWTARPRRAVLERNRALVAALAPAIQNIREDLRLIAARLNRAGCVDSSGAISPVCRQVLEGALEWQQELEGLAVQRGGVVVPVAGRSIQPPALATVRGQLRDLRDEATLHPVEVGGRILLVTAHRLSEGDERLLAWGQADQVLRPVENLRNDGPHRSGFASDTGRLLTRLTVSPAPGDPAERVLEAHALADTLRTARDSHDGLVFAGGVPYGFAVQRVPNTGLRVLTITSLGDGAAGRLAWSLWLYLGLGAVLLAVVAGIVWFAADALARRLEQMTAAVRRIGGGELDTAIPTTGSDEVGRLGTTLTAAMKRLRNAFDNLEQKVASRTRDLAARNEDLRRLREVEAEPPPPLDDPSSAASGVEGAGR